jgi:Ca2+-binding EF-hand superfamily protein
MIGESMIFMGVAIVGLTGTYLAANALEPYLPRSERAFARLDANSNGKVEPGELKPKALKRFLRIDEDSDGTVTSAEIDLYFARQAEKRKARLLGRLDKSGDGNITRDEVDAYVEALFNVADADHDGAVTLAETQESAARRKQALRVQGN